MTPVTFWFEFSSPYSYIAAERLRAAHLHAPQVNWRPFLLGPILKAKGHDPAAFDEGSPKRAYMWRDVERLAEKFAIPFERPRIFPQNGLMAARIATAFPNERWLVDFVCAVFHAAFAHGHDIAEVETLHDILDGMGLPTEGLIEEAEQPGTKKALRDATAEAQSLGIFGAPSFTVGHELFWGQDRLDDALDWARHIHLP
ncbi:MAG: 2-hydroxychromene-2-carboxylate isomerase [Geminicoccaceae bacterium]|nr:MAG: 2-hydroxychromene-2-carboxylate isomerase [Geminicoccaceae bacterium]